MPYENGDPEEWIIAESEHYRIKGRFEEADMHKKDDDSYITCVGDFYGDPHDGIIDKNERFCVTVGCGYIIYYLEDPFETYDYGKKTSQWIEAGRDPDNILWIEAVHQIGDTEIELEIEDGRKITVQIPISDKGPS